MREMYVNLTKRLALTAQETFGDFEEAVEKDATKTTVLDGTVHPLTSYVINYVKFLFEYVLLPILLSFLCLSHLGIIFLENFELGFSSSS